VDVSIRPLREEDLAAADRIMRLAFGTFLGLPDPMSFTGDAAYVHSRWRADPSAAFAAEIDGQIGGSNFAANWGSVGLLGPITTRPDLWDRGIGRRLMQPVLERFEQWGARHYGLFTFAHSQKHVGLYQKFGFWPQFLTAIMSKTIAPAEPKPSCARFSDVPSGEQHKVLNACRKLTDAIYEGLDVRAEVLAVARLGLGETVLLWDEGRLAGFAVCHCGPGSEAGSGTCYVKFGAVRSGPKADSDFLQLLDACEQLAAERNLPRLVAGVNTARHEAYRLMLERGFRTDLQGVAMQKANAPGYNRPGVYVIDDWR
jgi:GNAT superfamily N-acetyltransferase